MSTTLAAKLNHSPGTWVVNSNEPLEKVLPLDVSMASQSLSSNIFGSFTHQGGDIMPNPKLYNIFLGQYKSSVITQLNAFTIDLVKSSIADVLKQYGFVSGSVIGSAILETKVNNVSYRILNEPILQLIIQEAIDKQKIPAPAKDILYMIYLSDEISFDDPDLDVRCCGSNNNTAFGFHHYFKAKSGEPVIYALTPSLSVNCIANTCTSSPSCAMSTTKQTQLERITQVASHEFAEAVTNPTGGGWYDTKSGEEIADVCNGGSAKVTVGNNTWNMQTEYSLTDDKNTSGRLSCVSNTVSTTPLEFAQRLTNDELLKILFAAGAIMFISGLIYTLNTKQA